MSIEETVNNWTTDECSEAFSHMMSREDSGIATDFIQDEDDRILGTVLVVRFGDVLVGSEPNILDWPLQPCPMPEEVPIEILN